jgi:hypothetical protein
MTETVPATPRPREVYEANNWRFLTQTILEGQWFERKAHPAGQSPKDVKGFRYDRVARTIVAFANSNPDVGGLLVVGIADGGEIIGIDWCGLSYQNEILSAHELLDGPNPQMKLVEVLRENGCSEHLIFIFTPYLADRVAATTSGSCRN